MSRSEQSNSPAGRSHLSHRLDALASSGIRRFFDIAATMDDVISLSIGEPDFVTPRHIRDAAIASIEDGRTKYTSNYGLIELRQEIAGDLQRRYGVTYDPETEILVCSGVSEGLNIAMQALIDPGDDVLTPDPYYVAYSPNVVLAGGSIVPVPTRAEDGFRLHVSALRQAMTPRSKVLLIGYPANPTGADLEGEDIEEVSAFATENDLVVVSDEIYNRLVYGHEHRLIATVPGMRERTVVLGGFSKSYAMTGWRLGYAAGPAPLIEGIMKVHQYVMMSAPTAAQWAAIEAIQSGEADVDAMVESYDHRRRLMVTGLNAIGLRCHEPRGAFYAFPDVSASGLNDSEFAERLLLEQRVAVIPGSSFGDCGAGHVRCCYAASEDDIREALTRMARFMDTCKGKGNAMASVTRRTAQPPNGRSPRH
jgi:aminotransferase